MLENMTNLTAISVLWAIITTLSTIYFAHKMMLLGTSNIVPRFEIVYKRMNMPDIDVSTNEEDVEKYGIIQDYLLFRESNGKVPCGLEYEYWIKQRSSSKIIKRNFSNVAGRTFIPPNQVNNYRIIPLFLTGNEMLKIDNETVEKILWRVWYRDAEEKFKFCLCSVFERNTSNLNGWTKIIGDFHAKGLFPIIRCKAKKEMKRRFSSNFTQQENPKNMMQ